MKLVRLKISVTSLALCTQSVVWGLSIDSFRGMPPNAGTGTAIYPVAVVSRTFLGTRYEDLTSVSLYYGFGSSTPSSWTLYHSTSSPNNQNNFFDSNKCDTFGGLVGVGNTLGTFWIKAVATDASGASAERVASLTVVSASDAPSVLAAVAPTYTYGAGWLLDGGQQKLWWTSGRPADPGDPSPLGDGIVWGVAGQNTFQQSTGITYTTQTSGGHLTNSYGTHLISNPCVLKGTLMSPAFTSYNYAMYFVEPPGDGTVNNGIGMAYSNDGVTWEGKLHIIDSLYGDTSWGASSPSVIRKSNGNYAMLYADKLGQTLIYRESFTPYSWPSGSYSYINTDGLSDYTAGAAWGANPVFSYMNGYYYIAYTSGSTLTVRKIQEAYILSGTGVSWSAPLRTVAASEGLYHKHNAGFLRDGDGNLPGVGMVSYGTMSGPDGDVNHSQVYYVSFTP